MVAYFRSGLMSSDGSGNDYFFDVEFSENHDLENTVTQNPVMTGVSANDHVYRNPVVLTLDVGASDCFTINNGAIVSGNSRSMDAFSTLTGFYQNATLLDVYVGLCYYQNMIVKSVNAKRDKTLMHAMRATVVLQELIQVGETAISISADKQTTDSTSSGTKNPTKSESSSKSKSAGSTAASTLESIFEFIMNNPLTGSMLP